MGGLLQLSSASRSSRWADALRAAPGQKSLCRGVTEVLRPYKINLSQAFAGQRVGVKQVEDKIWLVSFMRYDLGFFDHETCRIESAANPFAAKLLPMSPV